MCIMYYIYIYIYIIHTYINTYINTYIPCMDVEGKFCLGFRV